MNVIKQSTFFALANKKNKFKKTVLCKIVNFFGKAASLR